MKVAGSSIASYYAGNAALKIEQQETARNQELHHQLKRRAVPQTPAEQILEGELLNKKRQRAESNSRQTEEKDSAASHQEQTQRQSFADHHSAPHQNPAVQMYQDTSRLDGFDNGLSPYQIDIYV